MIMLLNRAYIESGNLMKLAEQNCQNEVLFTLYCLLK